MFNETMVKRLIQEGKIDFFQFQGVDYQIAGPTKIPVIVENNVTLFNLYAYTKKTEYTVKNNEQDIFYLLMLDNEKLLSAPLIRVHSGCITGDIFGSLKCDCGKQLNSALNMIASEGKGGIIYIPIHEGRGIGGWNKVLSYILQEEGMDTYEANLAIGFPGDNRRYFDSAAILSFMYPQSVGIRLLSNNPEKEEALTSSGINIINRVSVLTEETSFNKKYLSSKVKNGHLVRKHKHD